MPTCASSPWGVRNVEWLADSGLAACAQGIACDAGCRAFDRHGIVTDDVFVAGDVARFPHPLFDYQMLSLEHWGNAVAQAQVAAHNMVSPGPLRRPHRAVPVFWSSQFGCNIKSVGVPTFSDQVVIAQGSLSDRRLVAEFPVPSNVPDPKGLFHGPTVALTGHLPDQHLAVARLAG